MTSIEQTCYTSMVNIRNTNVFASQLHESPYDNYSILKYNKGCITPENILKLGQYRSVIIQKDTGQLVCTSPSKSVPIDWFMEMYPPQDVIAEEFIEGTMINAFWDDIDDKWMLNTKGVVGAICGYYVEQTFYEMFIDACAFCNLQLCKLDKNICYSFVLKHPNNRIVGVIKHPQIYLIRAYKIHPNQVIEHIALPGTNYEFRQMGIGFEHSSVQIPAKYDFTCYDELFDRFASYKKTPYNVMGVVLKHVYLSHIHSKIRNPTYNDVRSLRGTTPKLDLHYLWLRKNNKLMDFLGYYPEYKADMYKYRKALHIFTGQLYNNYVNCYIYKDNNLCYFSDIYQRHMKRIHHIYLTKLVPINKSINKQYVIDYVNNLDIPIQVQSIRCDASTQSFDKM